MSSLQLTERLPFGAPATSGGGVLWRACGWFLVQIGGDLAIERTSGEETQLAARAGRATPDQTSAGITLVEEQGSRSAAIAELRRRSGLTWEQLAHLFGVDRRSVHFWASGKHMNAANEERLGRLVAVVRQIDRGSARDTRAALMTALDDGRIPYDLLAQGELDEVARRLGGGPHRASAVLPPLSPQARAARAPAPPEDLVGALHDTVHREVGKYRAARTVRSKRRQ